MIVKDLDGLLHFGYGGPIVQPDDPRHGTPNGYSNLDCRCRACRRANTVSMRAYRERRRRVEFVHDVMATMMSLLAMPHATSRRRDVYAALLAELRGEHCCDQCPAEHYREEWRR